MKNLKQLTRTLLITSLFLGVLWIALPPAGEAAWSGGRTETWELTAAAIQRSVAGDCAQMGALNVCRELCVSGQSTGEFACFIG